MLFVQYFVGHPSHDIGSESESNQSRSARARNSIEQGPTFVYPALLASARRQGSRVHCRIVRWKQYSVVCTQVIAVSQACLSLSSSARGRLLYGSTACHRPLMIVISYSVAVVVAADCRWHAAAEAADGAHADTTSPQSADQFVRRGRHQQLSIARIAIRADYGNASPSRLR